MIAWTPDRNALLPRPEVNRLLNLQIPEFVRIAELDGSVDRFSIVHLAIEDSRIERGRFVSRRHGNDALSGSDSVQTIQELLQADFGT